MSLTSVMDVYIFNYRLVSFELDLKSEKKLLLIWVKGVYIGSRYDTKGVLSPPYWLSSTGVVI